MRRVCLSLGGTTLCSSAQCYVTACHRRLNIPDPPAVQGRSVHAFSVWRDVSQILHRMVVMYAVTTCAAEWLILYTKLGIWSTLIAFL